MKWIFHPTHENHFTELDCEGLFKSVTKWYSHLLFGRGDAQPAGKLMAVTPALKKAKDDLHAKSFLLATGSGAATVRRPLEPVVGGPFFLSPR